MQPVRLFIFDLDGTLVDTLEDITASVNFTLTKLGVRPVPVQAVRGFVGDGLAQLLLRALDGRDGLLADATGIYTVHHSRHLADRSRLYPGVRETLDRFRAVPMAVVTNKTADFVTPLLDALGIGGLFRMVLGADSGLPLKPAPDALLHVLRTVGAPKEQSVMVGDGVTDLRAGKAAGVVTCAVTYGFRNEEQLRAEGPDHVIHAFPELTGLFRAA